MHCTICCCTVEKVVPVLCSLMSFVCYCFHSLVGISMVESCIWHDLLGQYDGILDGTQWIWLGIQPALKEVQTGNVVQFRTLPFKWETLNCFLIGCETKSILIGNMPHHILNFLFLTQGDLLLPALLLIALADLHVMCSTLRSFTSRPITSSAAERITLMKDFCLGTVSVGTSKRSPIF